MELIKKRLSNESSQNNKTKDRYKFFKVWTLPLIAALLISSIVLNFGFRVIIPTDSMYPTINKNDSVIAARIKKQTDIKRGDILVFYSKELSMLLVKRVIGLPGEKITINKEGQVYINEELLKEDYVKELGGSGGEFNIPQNKYLFLGDNRTHSFDSRYWKNPYVDFNEIEAKVVLRVFPYKKFEN